MYLFPAVPLHHSVYHRIVWRLGEFDIHTARIKTNACCRTVPPILSRCSAYGETRLIKFISTMHES